ncbi:MAG: hypothetical protein COA97_10095 [Flavobacteriales bacterium]|nr:MAG: hypothetical protein COA97_10095 [Flavobacteriales bacterium]
MKAKTTQTQSNKRVKALILLCLVVNFISTGSFAQSPNTLPATGDVGIGTLTPGAKLDVNGRMKVDSNAIFKDSVNIKKRLTVDQDIKVLGNSVLVGNVKAKSELKVLGVGKFKDKVVIDGLTKMNGDAKVFGNFKIKSLADPTLTSDRVMAINPNGKVKGLGGADLFKLIYEPPAACIQLPNGKIISGWLQNTSFPTYGVLYTTDECPVRVGIRTDNPQATLHLKGSFQLENGTQGLNKVLVSDVNGKATWKNPTSISDWTTATNGTDIYRPAGNVGIGTTVLGGKLTIGHSFDNVNGRANHIYLIDPTNASIKGYIGINNNTAAGPDKEYLSIQAVEENVHWMDIVLALEGGNVGIGTNAPAAKLDVNGNANISGVLDICPDNLGNTTSGLGEQWTSNDWNVRIKSPMNSAWVTTTPIPQGHSYQGSYMGIGMTSEGFHFMHSYSPPGHVLNPVRYPFIVKNSGLVIAREIKVSLTEGGNWPDYVFHKEYNLEPLCEVEKYIKKNKHLFGVPNKKEVSENGIKLGEMNAILLRKIEELTLYIIALEKRINVIEIK